MDLLVKARLQILRDLLRQSEPLSEAEQQLVTRLKVGIYQALPTEPVANRAKARVTLYMLGVLPERRCGQTAAPKA